MLDSYIILDFETANFERTSICQIGMIKVIENEIVDTMDQLILPIPNNFEYRNIEVHNIRYDDVKFAPKFVDFYDEFRSFIGALPVICHNASFDMSCLNKILQHYEIEHEYNFICSLVLCRRLLSFESNSLTYLAKFVLNYEYQAHDALSDCLATQELIKYLKKEHDLEAIIESYKIGTINLKGYSGFKKGK